MPRPRPVRCAWWEVKREALARFTQGKTGGASVCGYTAPAPDHPQNGALKMAELTVNQTSDGFNAAMDDATMERIEKAAQAQGTGQQRRCALVAMARDSGTLLRLAKESPEADRKSVV